MRTAFINELIVQARSNPNIFLVVGDLGYSVIEPFADEFPNRYINVGVAEQNMSGLAAGLASEGYHVFTYSIANFPTLRCLEQIRNDICYHNVPVTVVAVGAGLSYGNLGYSHHAVQDIGVMRTLPGIKILSPSDPGEASASVKWLAANPGPSYLRLGKAGEKKLYQTQEFSQLPVVVIRGKPDVAIVATGSILAIVLEAADSEIAAGRQAPTVISMPWIHPLNDEIVKELRRFKLIVCVEEHIKEGGLREILGTLLPRSTHITGISIPSNVEVLVGSQQYLRHSVGLTVSRIQQLINSIDFIS